MNPVKSQVKMVVAEELGRRFEEDAGAAHDSMCEHKGGKSAFMHAAKKISELGEHVDKDLKEGRIEEVVGEPLKIVAYVKQYIKRCVGVCDNLATAAEVAIHRTTGKELGLMDAAKLALKMRDEERNKLEEYVKALKEGGEVDGRSIDGHPGPSLKSQRKAEEATEQSEPEVPEQKQDSHEPPQPEQPKAKKPRAKTEPEKKRLRQPKKKR
jgi:hypothetical protein